MNLVNKYGDTPLDFAIESFMRGEDRTVNGEIIKLMLERGAEPNNQKDFFNEMEMDENIEEDCKRNEELSIESGMK